MGEDGEYTIARVKGLVPNHFIFTRKSYEDTVNDDVNAADIADNYLI